MSQGILLVTRNFPPNLGGMERLIHHVYLELKNDFKVTVLGPEGSHDYVVPDSRISSCVLSPTFIFLACLQWKAYRMARQLRPNLIIAGSGVAVPAALCAARSIDVPVVCYLHGLDLVARNPIYRSLFIPSIIRCDKVIANSQNTARLAREAGVNSASIHLLCPGVTIPSTEDSTTKSLFRNRYSLQDKIVLLSVGRIQPRKGLAEFIERVLPLLVSQRPEVTLVIIGAEPKNALNSAPGERQRVLSVAQSVGMERHVVIQGAVNDETLTQAYRESNLLIFPVRDIPGDVEGFGMVAIEAAAHGLPTVAFAVGGIPDAVKDNVSGYLIDSGDYTAFTAAVMRCINDEPGVWRDRCIEYARGFSWNIFGKKLRGICKEALKSPSGQRYSRR